MCWMEGRLRVDTVADPTIGHTLDDIIKITACAICGPTFTRMVISAMEAGTSGHENIGEVVELGSEVSTATLGIGVECRLRLARVACCS